MNYLYLALNFGTLLFPLLLSFDKKVAFYKNFKPLFFAIAIMATVFLVWDFMFTKLGVWGFNSLYLSGYYMAGMPIEEYMFFFTVPYACVFIYECLISYFPKSFNISIFFRYIPLFFWLFSLLWMVFYFDKLYSLIASLFVVFLGGFPMFRKKQVLRYFTIAFLISIIPMLVVNGLLTSKPVVFYNELEFSGIRVGTIPLEDFIYNYGMLWLTIGFYHYFKVGLLRPKLQTSSSPQDSPPPVLS